MNPDTSISDPPPLDRNKKFGFLFSSEFIPLASIVLFVMLLMYPFVFCGQALMPDTWKSIHPWARGVDVNENNASIYDAVLEYGPWYAYSQECLKEGRVPHWNPWQFCGAPLYANRLIPFFYPPFIMAEIIAQPNKIIGWFQLFNMILSGWGMYFLLRKWKLHKLSSIAGSMLWLTCGAHFLPFPLWTLGTIGFTWLILALEDYLEKPGVRPVLQAALIMGFILMVGYPVLVVHLGYFTVLYFLARWYLERRALNIKVSFITALTSILAVFIIGAGISAIANLPAWNYSKETVRQVGGFIDKAFEREKRMLITPPDEAGLDPFAARFGERIDILLPVNGQGTQRAWQYGGVLIYFLAFLGLMSGKPRAFLLFVLGVLFAVPIWFPEVYILLISILPGWAVTILLPIQVVNLVAYLLAAMGIDSILYPEKEIAHSNVIRKIKTTLVLLLAVGTVVFTFRFLCDAPVINLPILFEVHVPNLLATSRFHLVYLITVAVLSLWASISFTRLVCNTISQFALVISLIIFSTITFWYLQPVYSEADYTPITPFISDWAVPAAVVENPADGNRIVRWAVLPVPFNPHKRAKSPFDPNLHMEYKLMDIGGYDSLVPYRFIRYCTLFEDPFIDYRALISFRAASSTFHRRMRALGVRWIITQGELPREAQVGMPVHIYDQLDSTVEVESGCTPVWDDRYDGDYAGTDDPDDFMQVWEIDNPQPRAFLTDRIAFSSAEFDDPLVQGENWEVRGINLVVVEDPEKENRSTTFYLDSVKDDNLVLPGSSVKIEIDEPEFMRLSVDAPDDCYLVLRDGWNPEWVATVDGIPVKIYPADAAFRAVKIPEGSHSVEFKFKPSSFRAGMLITIATLFIMSVAYLLSGGYTRKIRPVPSNL